MKKIFERIITSTIFVSLVSTIGAILVTFCILLIIWNPYLIEEQNKTFETILNSQPCVLVIIFFQSNRDSSAIAIITKSDYQNFNKLKYIPIKTMEETPIYWKLPVKYIRTIYKIQDLKIERRDKK